MTIEIPSISELSLKALRVGQDCLIYIVLSFEGVCPSWGPQLLCGYG